MNAYLRVHEYLSCAITVNYFEPFAPGNVGNFAVDQRVCRNLHSSHR